MYKLLALFSSCELVNRLYLLDDSDSQSILWDNDIKSTKHTLKEMIMHYSCLELAEGKAINKSDTTEDLA